MSYKPKFCCECSEKIEQVDWKPWTSRRFCQLCATEHGIGEKLQMGLIAAAVLFGLVGLGSFWQKTGKSSNTASNLISVSSPNKNKTEANQAVTSQVAENSSVQPLAHIQTTNSAIETQTKTQVSTTQNLKTRQTQLRQNPSAQDETVYFCGAQTKKGTACSRRMKGGGRCWQHSGQPAMLPPEKLIAINN